MGAPPPSSSSSSTCPFSRSPSRRRGCADGCVRPGASPQTLRSRGLGGDATFVRQGGAGSKGHGEKGGDASRRQRRAADHHHFDDWCRLGSGGWKKPTCMMHTKKKKIPSNGRAAFSTRAAVL